MGPTLRVVCTITSLQKAALKYNKNYYYFAQKTYFWNEKTKHRDDTGNYDYLYIYLLSPYFMFYHYMITSNIFYGRFYDALYDCSNIIMYFVCEF